MKSTLHHLLLGALLIAPPLVAYHVHIRIKPQVSYVLPESPKTPNPQPTNGKFRF